MGVSAANPLLDHIVILVPHSFLTSPPEWFAKLFTFYPGGQHADGLTENTLVLLPDGSYIEFIAFVPGIDLEKRGKHKWGGKKEGTVIDWALTLPASAGDGLEEPKIAFEKIQTAVEGTQTGLIYGELVPGGRQRPDGKLLEWAVASAYRSEGSKTEAIEPGILPFWCLDGTKRELRVPYLQNEFAEHPTGAVGVALVSVTPGDQLEAEKLDKVYDVLLGGDASDYDSLWHLETIAGKRLHGGSQIRLQAVRDKASLSIALFTNSGKFGGQELGGKVTDDIDLKFDFVSTSL